MANDVDLVRGGTPIATYDLPSDALAASSPGDEIHVGETDSPYYDVIDFSGRTSRILIPKSGESPTIIGGISALGSVANGQWTYDGITNGRAVYYTTYSYSVNNVTGVRAATGMRLWTYGTSAGFQDFYAGEGIYLDTGANRLYCWLYEDEDPNDVALWVSRDDWAIRLYNSNNIYIGDGLTIRVGGESVIQLRYDSYENEINGCTISNGQRGIWCNYATGHNNQHSNVFDGNTIYDTYQRHRWAWRHVKSTDYDAVRRMETAGVNIETGGTGVRVRNNTIYGWMDGVSVAPEYSGTPYLDDCRVYDNVIRDNRDDAFCIEGYHQDTRIYGNLVYDTYIGLAARPHPRGPTYVYRNRFIIDRVLYYDEPDEHDWPRWTKIGDNNGTSSENVKVYHNTVYTIYDGIDIYESDPPSDDEWYNNVIYSARRGGWADEMVQSVNLDTDDAEETGAGVMGLYSTDLDLGGKEAGIRLQLNVEQGAWIAYAILRLTPSASASAGGHFRIYAEDTDDADTFNTDANNITNRTRTSEYLPVQMESWTSGSHVYFNVTPIVQEIVDRPGFESGNYIALLLVDNDGTEHPVWTLDGSVANCPRLTTGFVLDAGDGNGRLISGTGLAADGNELDYNCYYGEGSGTKFRNWNSSSNSFTSLALARAFYSGWEGDGLESDPGLNVSTYPYPLTIGASSPARNAGRTLPIGWPDSVSVDDGQPDMGFHEYKGGLPVRVVTVTVTVAIMETS